jgi:hypothetical protein
MSSWLLQSSLREMESLPSLFEQPLFPGHIISKVHNNFSYFSCSRILLVLLCGHMASLAAMRRPSAVLFCPPVPLLTQCTHTTLQLLAVPSTHCIGDTVSNLSDAWNTSPLLLCVAFTIWGQAVHFPGRFSPRIPSPNTSSLIDGIPRASFPSPTPSA